MINRIIICAFIISCFYGLCTATEDCAKYEDACLLSEKVNVRVGPGEEYPVIFKYSRKLLPLRVIARFGAWRKIRDKDGDEGWVLSKFISKKRTIIVDKNTLLYTKPNEKSIKLAILEKGIVAEVTENCGDFLKIKFNCKSGWVKKVDVWGAK